jgi:hypothetical protein
MSDDELKAAICQDRWRNARKIAENGGLPPSSMDPSMIAVAWIKAYAEDVSYLLKRIKDLEEKFDPGELTGYRPPPLHFDPDAGFHTEEGEDE